MDILDELLITMKNKKAISDLYSLLVELRERREFIGFNYYQKIAMRTANVQCKNIANFGLGLSGESGEVVEIIKKHLFHGHELDKDKIVKEMGDCAWYLALGCEILGVSFEEMIKVNIEKLEKRYPNGFSFDKSINRE